MSDLKWSENEVLCQIRIMQVGHSRIPGHQLIIRHCRAHAYFSTASNPVFTPDSTINALLVSSASSLVHIQHQKSSLCETWVSQQLLYSTGSYGDETLCTSYGQLWLQIGFNAVIDVNSSGVIVDSHFYLVSVEMQLVTMKSIVWFSVLPTFFWCSLIYC